MFVKRSARFVFVMSVLLITMISLTGVILAAPKDSVPVQSFADGSVIPGASSKLEREEDEVEVKLKTNVTPYSTYTLWYVVFNNPEYCSDACGEDDLLILGGNPLIDNSVLWAAGGVADGNGKIKLVGTLEEGEDSAPGQVLFGPGLIDAQKAEIHFVVRDHGPDDQGLLYEQTHTFGGGCDDTAPEDGGGTYTCVDVQFAVHLP